MWAGFPCRIPAGRYAKFVIHGDMVQAVAAAWQEIWQINLPRTFQCDFEEYQDDSMKHAEIHIYVGLLENENLNRDAETMIESRCGILCSECTYREQVNCEGCIHIQKLFWGDSCPVKSCCETKTKEHCGNCENFPCDLLNQFAYDEKQGDGGKRIEQCKIGKIWFHFRQKKTFFHYCPGQKQYRRNVVPNNQRIHPLSRSC